MRFLFVRPELCPLGELSTPKIRLSSDSAPQRTPLPLANPSRYRAASGLSPYRTGAHRAHSELPCPIPRGRAVYGQLNRAPTHHGTFPHQEAITDGCFNRRTLVLTAILQKRKKPAISPLDKLPLAQYNTYRCETDD